MKDNSSRFYSVKSVYDWLVSNSAENFEFSKIIWKNLAPPKVQFFVWLVVNERVKTGELLLKRGILQNACGGWDL